MFQICSEQNIPVRYIGVGEAITDLQTFDPDQFVDFKCRNTANVVVFQIGDYRGNFFQQWSDNASEYEAGPNVGPVNCIGTGFCQHGRYSAV